MLIGTNNRRDKDKVSHHIMLKLFENYIVNLKINFPMTKSYKSLEY